MNELRAIVRGATGRRVTDERPVGGGCINDARLFTLDDGGRVFAKTHPEAQRYPDLFKSEAAGLTALADAVSSLHVPRPIAAGADFIVMEAIDVGSGGDLDEKLGRGLAELHQSTAYDRFGFHCDNYLGITAQANGWMDDWVAFWAERRLKPMLDCLRGEPEIQALGGRLLDRLDAVLRGGDEPAALLHGDLWSGNALLDAEGRACIIDPACYYGHREADLGMTRLFGLGPRFEAAYREVYPLTDGADRRIAVYTLHHLLNHLLIFGGGYRGQCVALLTSICSR